MPQNKTFKNFTNLYELSKTLRFELKPVEETKELLKKVNLQGKTPVQTDQEIDDLYRNEMKPMLDKLHEKFINEALEKVSFENSDLEKLENLYLELDKLKKELKALISNKDDRNESRIKINKIEEGNKKRAKNIGEIEQLQSKLRGSIVKKFNETAKKWKCDLNGIETDLYNEKGNKKIKIDIKKETYEFLKEDNVLAILAHFNSDKIDKISKFQRFTTYFTGFNKNRENYYSLDNKATGVANRAINQNLILFLNNKVDFNKFIEKMPNLAKYGKYFELKNFRECLAQEGIEKYNDTIGEIKSKVNLGYNQKIEDKKQQLNGLEKLQKQIGCRTKQQREQEKSGENIYPKYLEKIGLGFQITRDSKGKYQIWEALEYLTQEVVPKIKKIQKNYQNFFENWQKDSYNLSEIWLRKESINTISSRWFGGNNWYILGKALSYLGTGKIDKKDDEYKIPLFVSLQKLKEAMEALEKGIDFDIRKSRKKSENELVKDENKNSEKFYYSPENLFKKEHEKYYRKTLFETFLAIWQSEVDHKLAQIFDGYKAKNKDGNDKFVPDFLDEFKKQSKYSFDKNKKNGEKSIHIETVKNLVEEGYLRLFQLTKYHNLEKKGEVAALSTESKFYEVLKEFWENNEIVTYHKAFQTTLTKKLYSEDKIKLNFDNGNLLEGFSDGQEKNKAGVILKNKNKFHLGILKNRGFFRTDKPNLLYQTKDNDWQRLILTNLKFQTLAGKGFLGKHGISYGALGKTDPMKAVNLLKEFIKTNYVKKYPQLKFIANKSHKNKKYFDAEIKKVLADCFTMKFVPIKYDILCQGLKNDLYLFEIANKDFSKFSNGKNKNIHTLYWQKLFSDENLRKPIFALNGGAKVFFRQGQKAKLNKKVDQFGKVLTFIDKRDDNKEKEVLQNRRYGDDKYFLHASITINYSKPKIIKFRESVNKTIKENYDDIKIIGIDRGEKNLLYYSVIDSQGKIIEQDSLNIINGVDYNDKLQKRQDKRKQARLDWEEIGNIKNFKEGYLSQAINKIYELIIKHNAIIVLEDLNSEFKAKRTAKVEKSVYKKFELALAKKLNHLILKNKESNELGGVLNAYQLTPYIKPGDMSKFEKAKQWGILFYVRANYTSTTDPLTGWRKHKYISNSETPSKIQNIFNPNTGIQINYDSDKKCFRFSYEIEGIFWELFAFNGLQRFRWNNEKRKMELYDLYKEFEKLFLGLDKSKSINQQIKDSNGFKWKSLVFLWNLLNQIRNTDREEKGIENDFLQSPIWSEKYKCFYDSRKVSEDNLPDNGDANGAYNIARKGAMILERIKNCKNVSEFGNDNNGKNPENSYYVSDKDWDKFVLKQ